MDMLQNVSEKDAKLTEPKEVLESKGVFFFASEMYWPSAQQI